MIKELKYLFFIFVIILFFIITFKHYFSDSNKKNSYRSLKNINQKILIYSQKLKLLDNDTDKVVEYVDNTIDKNKKNYNFWELLNNDN
jgi:hypothetical protein